MEYQFKIKTSFALLEASILGLMLLMPVYDSEWVQNFALNGYVKSLMIFLTITLLLYYVLFKRKASIRINKTGIYFRGISFFYSGNDITWNNHQLIEIDGSKPTTSFWYMKAGENTLQFLNTENNKNTEIINLNWYQHIDRKKFDAIYQSLSLKTTIISESDYVKEFDPSNRDLGEKSGYLAYGSLGLIVIIAIMAYFDEYRTIDFGYIGHVAVIIGFIIAFFCWKFLTTEDEMIDTNWLVVLLFSSILSATLIFALMIVATQFASKEIQTFQYKKINSSNEAIWENKVTKQTFWCRVPNDFQQSNQQMKHMKKHIKVIKSMSMTRVHISEACPK